MQCRLSLILGSTLLAVVLALIIFNTLIIQERSLKEFSAGFGLGKSSPDDPLSGPPPAKNKGKVEAEEDEEEETRYAFATYLTDNLLPDLPDDEKPVDVNPDYEDGYFMSTRVLTYQLLHSASTRSRPRIPFVVVVTEDVTASKRDRLTKDGAKVVQIDKIDVEWIHNGTGFKHWRDVLGKLRIWTFTQYERICFIDADHMIVDRIDGVFRDPATQLIDSGKNASRLRDDEAPIPPHYVMASLGEPPTRQSIPPEPFDKFGAGFFVMQPSQQLFDYYMSIAHIPYRFWPVYPEQNLINYAHRREGNMPWQDLDWHFNVHIGADIEHLKAGIKSFHDKFWMGQTPLHGTDDALRAIWRYQQAEMEAFFADRDAASTPR